jgi:Fe-S-cluster containining protein
MEQSALPVGYYCGVLSDREGEARKLLPLPLYVELKELVARYDKEGWPADGTPCIWLDLETKQCKHYQYRPPDICDEGLALGDEACLHWRKAKGVDPMRRWRMVRGKLVEVS